jgi:hypothetical protein
MQEASSQGNPVYEFCVWDALSVLQIGFYNMLQIGLLARNLI